MNSAFEACTQEGSDVASELQVGPSLGCRSRACLACQMSGCCICPLMSWLQSLRPASQQLPCISLLRARLRGAHIVLQVARLRLEAHERERAALALELTATQTRLQDALVGPRRPTASAWPPGPHPLTAAGQSAAQLLRFFKFLPMDIASSLLDLLPDPVSKQFASTSAALQEVLEGVLGERSALRRQAQELQAQLAAALAEQQVGSAAGGSPCATRAQQGSPSRQQLRRELVLARAQLRDLACARLAWEAERAQLVQEVEEERQRLQEGLAEALGQACAAQVSTGAGALRGGSL